MGERNLTVGGYGLALRSVMKGWVGVKFMVKRRYVTIEWPLTPLFAGSAGDQWPVAASNKHWHGGSGFSEVLGIFRV